MKLTDLTEGMRARGEKGLVPFLTAGYPDRATFSRLVAATAEAGCRVLEIGVPFSDPIADGPVIQAASQQALAGGATLGGALEMAGEAARDHGLAPVLMGYLNPILRYGAERFADACAARGVAGAIVPDLPLEESAGLRELLIARGVALIDLAAPVSGPERLRMLGAGAEGFLYLVSVTGVTGTAADIERDLAAYVARVRAACRRPLYVGFGVSDPERARRVAAHADGVIIGSALVRFVQEAPDADAAVAAVGGFLRDVRTALDGRAEGGRA